MKRILAALALVLALPVVAVGFPCPKHPIRVGLYEAGDLYQQKRNAGFDKDMIDELARRTGCDFQVEVLPRARIWYQLAQGQLDMTTSGVFSPDRASYAWFIPYAQFETKAFVSRHRNGTNWSTSEFIGNEALHVGVVRGYRYSPALNRMVSRLKSSSRVEEVADATQLISMLRADRVQAILLPAIILGRDNGPLVQETRWEGTNERLEFNLVFARTGFDAEAMAAWIAVVDAMRRDRTIDRALDHYTARRSDS
ncbi:MAG: transporter substrate-binding domain-containing protein [Burkholderiales bacterium]|nr:transporter substrate-binding domain-containing protein [Burkholderiales bacterium]